MTFEESIQWLEGVSWYSKKDGLENMKALMHRLGDVQNQIPWIHVAGTNGKGTVCTLLSTMLQAGGKHVGIYTSPHLVHYNERICVDGQAISDDDFAMLATRVRKEAEALAAEGTDHPTFFQLLTAIAFLYFAMQKVDMGVLEVGVGGRLDATNIIQHPKLCVITSISLDHTKVLGNTLEQIAGEKSGIMKANVPVVAGTNPPEVYERFRKEAKLRDAQLIFSENMHLKIQSNDLRGIVAEYQGQRVQTKLRGLYQEENLKTAITAAETLDLTTEQIIKGLENADWPGRMQLIVRGEAKAPWLLEGAHNPSGAASLAKYVTEQFSADRDITLVFSALSKKDTQSILHELLKAPFSRIVFGQLEYSGGMTPEVFEQQYTMQSAADGVQIPMTMKENIAEALNYAESITSPKGLIVCAGSLYFVGEILGLLEKKAL